MFPGYMWFKLGYALEPYARPGAPTRLCLRVWKRGEQRIISATVEAPWRSLAVGLLAADWLPEFRN